MKQAEIIKEQTATGTIESVSYDLGDLLHFSVYVKFTGSNVAGTLVLQATDSLSRDFVTISGSSQSVTGSENHVWDVEKAGYRYVRVKYTHSSGTGDISAFITAKEMFIKNG